MVSGTWSDGVSGDGLAGGEGLIEGGGGRGGGTVCAGGGGGGTRAAAVNGGGDGDGLKRERGGEAVLVGGTASGKESWLAVCEARGFVTDEPESPFGEIPVTGLEGSDDGGESRLMLCALFINPPTAELRSDERVWFPYLMWLAMFASDTDENSSGTPGVASGVFVAEFP